MFGLIILIVLFLGLGVGVTILFGNDQSYFLARYGDWQIENNLLALFLICVVSYVLIWLTIKIVLNILGARGKIRSAHKRRKQQSAHKSLNDGLIDLLECDYSRAEKNLIKSVSHSDTPLLNYLGAARAAAHQNNDAQRDEYLQTALTIAPKAKIAVLLTKAELQLNQNQNDAALITLTDLQSIAPKNPSALKLLSRLHAQLQDWSKLASILPALRKTNVLSETQLNALSVKTYTGLLENASESELNSSVNDAWNALPSMMKKDSRLITVYVTNLIRADQHKKAEKLIRSHLNKKWDENLIKLYSQLSINNDGKLLQTCTSWQNAKPNSPNLLLAMARFNRRLGDTEKAKAHYQHSIELSPCVEAYAEYNELVAADATSPALLGSNTKNA